MESSTTTRRESHTAAPPRSSDPFPRIFVALAVLYVAFQLSPSSYAQMFDRLGIERHGLLAGEPRLRRSDEWNIHTPLIQIAVDNGFARDNRTSIYGEDLRSLYPLPLLDWGIALKPAYWGFFVHPAFGYSLLHGFHLLAMLLGFHLLLRRVGASAPTAAAASVVVVCSGFVQLWWMHLGMMLAYLPWVSLALAAKGSDLRRLGLLVAVLCCMMFSTQFYPPLWVSIGLLGLLLAGLIGDRRTSGPSFGRSFALVSAAGLVSSLLVCGYQMHFILSSLDVETLGGRRIAGGGVPWEIGASLLLPGFVFEGFEAVGGFFNACESSTVGSHLPLLALVFADFRGRPPQRSGARAPLPVAAVSLIAAFALYTLAWTHLPSVPWQAGAPLLWHQTVPQRLGFVPGIAATVLSVYALGRFGARLTVARLALFAAIVLGAWWLGKGVWMGRPLSANRVDLVVVPALLAAWGVWRLVGDDRRFAAADAVACAALCANVVLFAGYNPVQRAGPIFERPREGVVPLFEEMQRSHPRQRLVVEGDWAASLDGYGFRSVSAVFFHPPGPHARDVLMNDVFGAWDVPADIADGYVRIAPFSHDPISNEPVERPTRSRWVANVILLPIPPDPIEARVAPSGIAALEGGDLGCVDAMSLDHDDHVIRLQGWRRVAGPLIVETDLPLHVVSARSAARPDVVGALGDGALWRSGWDIELRAERAVALDELSRVRVLVDDPARGPTPLSPPLDPPARR